MSIDEPTVVNSSITLRSIEDKVVAGEELTEEEENFLVSKVNVIWDNHPDVQFRFPRWRKIIAWVAGYQYYDYNTKTRELMDAPIPRPRRLVFNRLRSFSKMLLSKLASSTPQGSIIPNTDEQADIDAAEIGDMVYDFLSDKLNFATLQRTFKMWYILANAAYLRVFWNEEDEGALGTEDRETKDETGTVTDKRTVVVKEPGDVGMEVVSPFNCRHDPLKIDRREWRWFIYGHDEDAEALEEEYGLERGTLVDNKATTSQNPYTLELTGDKDFSVARPMLSETITGRVVTKKQLWTKRIYVYTAGNTFLEAGGNPEREIPFFKYEERLVPIENYEKGMIYNDSTIKDMIPVQREYNRWKRNISKALERACKVKILMPFDATVNKAHFLEDAGTTIIDYNSRAGPPPHQLQLDPLPAFAPQHATDLEREFESIGGLHEASFGRLPERASHASGTLVNLLVEQDDVVIDPIVGEIDRVFSDAWRFALELVQNNYAISRLIKVVGTNHASGCKKFSGADLRGNTDIRVSSSVGLPKSRALRTEYILKLMQLGLLTDQKTILELLEFGDARRVFTDQLLHEKRALRENSMIEDRKYPNMDSTKWVYQFEDSMAHMKIHLRLRIGPKWDQLTPEQQAVLESHIQATAKKLQVEAAAQAQAQAQAQAAKNPQPGPQKPIPQEAGPTAPQS
jgi:hypothetical protein